MNNLSVRLPEILGFWVMLAALYVFVARRSSSLSGLCAAAFPLVTNAYSFAFEARPYGLLLGFGALALVSWQSVTLNRRRPVALVCLAASVAAAVSTQYYGVLVLLPLALGEGVLSLTRRRLDLPVWAALAFSIVPLALHFPLMRAGAAYSSAFWSRPQWVNVPDFYIDLLTTLSCRRRSFSWSAASTRSSAAIRRRQERARRACSRCTKLPRPAGSSSFPFVCVVLAKVATGAFVNRYAIPAVLGFAVLAGFGAAAAFRRSAAMRFVVAVSSGRVVPSQPGA